MHLLRCKGPKAIHQVGERELLYLVLEGTGTFGQANKRPILKTKNGQCECDSSLGNRNFRKLCNQKFGRGNIHAMENSESCLKAILGAISVKILHYINKNKNGDIKVLCLVGFLDSATVFKCLQELVTIALQMMNWT